MTARPIPSDIQRVLMLSAIIDNSVPRATRLLSNGFDVNHIEESENNNGKSKTLSSLLNLLIIEGDHPQMTKLLIDFGIDFEHKNVEGHTPLTQAIGAGHLGTVEVLLDSGAHPDNPGGNGFLPLYFAMQTMGEKGPQLTRLLLNGGASLKHFNKHSGESALEVCVKQRQIECIKVLLAYGEDPNKLDPFSRRSPLMLAQSLREECINGRGKYTSLSKRQVDEFSETAGLLKAWADAKVARDAIEAICPVTGLDPHSRSIFQKASQ